MAQVEFIIPVYNEADGLAQFHKALKSTLAGSSHQFRYIYVDDGSEDATCEVLARIAESDPTVLGIELSRNFGHQAAITAGLAEADGDAIVMMDGDGEHPPSLVPEMLRLFEIGYDVVQAQRIDAGRRGVAFKRLTGSIFYWLISRFGQTKVTSGTADFRLLSRAAVAALNQMSEYHRFYRGMVPWIGFRTVTLPFTPDLRLAGNSKYTLRKMLRLASDGLFSFSMMPLRLAIILGIVLLLLACGQSAYVLAVYAAGQQERLVPGWTSLMLVLTISSGISMILQGILGLYIGMIFQEVKRRPVYLVRSRVQSSGAQVLAASEHTKRQPIQRARSGRAD